MENFAAEFSEICSMYLDLERELKKIVNDSSGDKCALSAHSILRIEQSIEQVSQLNARIAALSEDWGLCRNSSSGQTRDETDKMASAARAHAVRLKELCSLHVQKLQETRQEIRNNLLEIGKGARFIREVKLSRPNYPKFIDSSH